ncbi:2-keto-4-pentenoate hydratase [Actinomadura sp. CNU-125]|uniref:2-keto-4-pentenoate hydratase n=1 Tax=Actinomadura sp. CNU-125 TaxID=1904961 RepID=UPI0021CD0CFC|nr:hypothetical protein [Actinomadura sp. CNU-125]
MDPGSVEKAAGALLNAYATGTPISPLTNDHPDMSIADAYAVQAVQVRTWTQAGARVKGHKVGLTSAAMQRQLGVNYPDSGVLLDSMFLPENDAIERSRFLQPRVEPEVAFVLGRPLAGPGVTAADASARWSTCCPRWRSSTPGSRTGRSSCRTRSPTTPPAAAWCSAPGPSGWTASTSR